MALSRRQRVTVVSLLLYWPAIFILSHIPVPRLIVKTIKAPDKTLHFLTYFILVFLLWFAINPDRKVNWRKAAAWWVLFVVVWYGVFDEWLQGYVGRNPDVMDFFADLTGTLACLILLSIFPFWPVCLVVTATAIFILTTFSRAGLAHALPVTNTMFHLFSYGFFTILWIRYIHHFLPPKAPEPKWLIGASALPIGFLLAVELFSVIAGNGFQLQSVIASAGGVAAVIVTIYLTVLLRRHLAQKHLSQ